LATASQDAGGGFVAGIRPYLEPAPLTALFLGISSGFPFTLLAATLTQRLSEAGIEKKLSGVTWGANVFYMQYKDQLVTTGKICELPKGLSLSQHPTGWNE